ncbi:MAG TPA: isoprenylcysteine carboxylmethyltransferase family protein [Pyrinomonadaceae bacterium]|jgi:protein-S-isoprenylcysteine O-methyltransferase Ste14
MNDQTNLLPLSDYALHAVVFGVVVASWFVFGLAFALFLRRKPSQGTERRRDSSSKLGFALQGASYAFVWAFMRQTFTHIAPLGQLPDIALGLVTIALATGSVWFMLSAMQRLGKQWSLTARVLEGHNLITEGTYRWVRHPIYTGMFGLLVANGLAVSRPYALLVGIAIFWVGTVIRVRSEERLLRATFGAEYEEYARRVPAVLPGIY